MERSRYVKRRVRLSGAQVQAIELLVAGQTKKATAAAVGVATFSVTRWHEQDVFMEALEQRRQEVMQGNTERLRALVGKAIDVMEAALADENARVRLEAARLLLQAAQVAGVQKPKERRSLDGSEFQWTIREREDMRAKIWQYEVKRLEQEKARLAEKEAREERRREEAAWLAAAQADVETTAEGDHDVDGGPNGQTSPRHGRGVCTT